MYDNYLTLIAQEANVNIELLINGSIYDDSSIQYLSADVWNNYDIGSNLLLKLSGDFIRFRNNNNYLSIDNKFGYAYFSISGKVKASGDIMSMVNFSNSIKPCSFANLFQNCTGLMDPPLLSSINLNKSCYYGMFTGLYFFNWYSRITCRNFS